MRTENKMMKSKHPHLISVLLAILWALGVLVFGTIYAQSLEDEYVHVLAPLVLHQSNLGSALQQAGFQQPDLLMVYGSSEMLVEDKLMTMTYGTSTKISIGSTPFGASQFFRYYPTGFDVYEIAKGGASSLDIAQDLAAIGPELRGKKVVFSFAPSMFNEAEVAPTAYAAGFSLLHANALIFNTQLSLETKQIAAERMNDYPNTLRSDSVLQFAIQQLNCKCWYGPYLYDLTWPLGQLDTQIIRLQDHWAVLNYIWGNPSLNPKVLRKPQTINWSYKISKAVWSQKMYSNNNPYGFENDVWNAYFSKLLASRRKPGSGDPGFVQALNDSKEWTDFDLVLRILKEMGAQPLVLSRPIDGPKWNALGVSQLGRQAYYIKLQNAVLPYGFPFEDFADHDGDRYFSIDPGGHTSREGWVYVDETLNAFFHGQIR
jgi:D-alanine transfer protein